jgi:hypothetical protein
MKLRTAFAGVLLAIGAAAVPTMGQARVVEFDVTVAPPAPPVAVAVTPPAPRPGFIYEPAHYAWDGQRFVWIDAQFIAERPGHVYTPYVLDRRGEKWHFRAGHWDDD